MNVYILEERLWPGTKLYRVMVDNKEYDRMTGKRLTWSEQRDIANGYKEALEGYEGFVPK